MTSAPRLLLTLGFSAVAMFVTLAAPSAARADESRRGPLYVQVHPIGVDIGFTGTGNGGPSSTDAYYPIEVHGGYHISGRHDGFVVGATQRFSFGPQTAGSTVARLGWDLAFALGGGAQELVVAPYAFGGARYVFKGGDPAGYLGFGVEGRYFVMAKAAPAATQARAMPRVSTTTLTQGRLRAKSAPPVKKSSGGAGAPATPAATATATPADTAGTAGTTGGSSFEGLYLVLKPFELGFATGTPSMTTLTFQAGVGYAF